MLANSNTFERTKCEGGCCRPMETSGGSVNWHLFLREINLPCLRNHFDIVEISPSYSTFKVHSIGNSYPCGPRNRSKGVHSNNVPNSTKLQTTPRFVHREWINKCSHSRLSYSWVNELQLSCNRNSFYKQNVPLLAEDICYSMLFL